MTTEKNKEVIKQFFDALTHGDVDKVLSLCTDDLVWWFAGDPPVGGEVNKAALRQKFQYLLKGVFKGAFESKVVSMIAEGNQVAVRGESNADTVFGTHYNNHYHFLFEFRDDKISRAYEYNDTAHANRILRPPKTDHRPDAAHLDPVNYVHATAITTRYSDLDTQGHLNNVAVAELLETARVRFLHHIYQSIGINFGETRGVIVAVHIDYLGEGSLIDDVIVHSAFGKAGNTSFVIKQLIKQRDTNIAAAQTTAVRMDENGPHALPTQFKEAMNVNRFKG